ncbi:MAG: MFS transporter [Actinomycetota bacterium]
MLVTFAGLAYFISVGMIFPVLPRFVKGPLGGSNVAVGFVAGAFSVSAVLLRPFAGRLGDRFGRKILVLTGAAIAAVSIGAYSVAGSLIPIVALRLLNGVGEALFFTGAATTVADLAPAERRGEAISFFSLALYVGIGAGPFVGESILADRGFAAVWLVSAAICAAAVILSVKIPDTRPVMEGENQRSHLIHPAAVLPGIVMALSVCSFAGFSSFISLHTLDLGMSGSRYVFGTYAAVILTIRSLGAKIPDRLGARRTASISLIVSAAGLVLMGLARAPWSLFPSVALFAIGQALSFPALMSLAAGSVPAGERSSAIGTFTAFIDVAFGAGPLTLGLVAEAGGYPGVFLVSAALSLVGLLILRTRSSATSTAGRGAYP